MKDIEYNSDRDDANQGYNEDISYNETTDTNENTKYYNYNSEIYEDPDTRQGKETYGYNNGYKKPKKGGFLIGCLLGISLMAVAWIFLGNYMNNDSNEKVDKKAEKKSVQIVQNNNASSPNFITKLVDEVMPSIVTISTETLRFDQFSNNPISKEAGNGTGFIVSETDDSYNIATNNHVIGDASKINVTFIDNSTVSATVKGSEKSVDVALIVVKKSDINKETLGKIKVAKIGKSANTKIGEDVIAIGNALGYGQSVTRGIVSAVNRGKAFTESEVPLIQTDAAINPGNSGGPLVNTIGEVIGINTVKIASDKIEGMGYAIPSDVFVPELNFIEKGENGEKPYLGIVGKVIDEQVANMYNLPNGVYIDQVIENSPAYKAGIKRSDIIMKFDGENVVNTSTLIRILRKHKNGDKVTAIISSLDGKKREVEVTLETKK